MYRPSPIRWYILLVFSLHSMQQWMVFNTFGPIAFAVQSAYGWSDSTLALLANWGSIAFVVSLAPVLWFLQARGLRAALIVNTLLVLIGTGVRTLTIDDDAFEILCHVGAFLNGIAGVLVMSAPPLVTAIWFPEKERIFATSVSQCFNVLGAGVSYLIGPLAVPFDETSSMNVADTKNEIRFYMIGLTGAAAVLFFAVLLYFPQKPDVPPSAISEVPRMSKVWSSVKTLVSDRRVWFFGLAFAVPNGIQGSWQSIMALTFNMLGISDDDIGMIGLSQTASMCALGAIVAFAQDRFRDKMRITVTVALSASVICYIWLGLLCAKAIPFSLWQIYVSSSLATALNYACVALYFESAVIAAHPVAEGIVGGFLSGLFYSVSVVFLLLFLIPMDSYLWVNYVLIGGVAVGIPLYLLAGQTEDIVDNVKYSPVTDSRSPSLLSSTSVKTELISRDERGYFDPSRPSPTIPSASEQEEPAVFVEPAQVFREPVYANEIQRSSFPPSLITYDGLSDAKKDHVYANTLPREHLPSRPAWSGNSTKPMYHRASSGRLKK